MGKPKRIPPSYQQSTPPDTSFIDYGDGDDTTLSGTGDQWDDQELIQAWDRTVADYRKYHKPDPESTPLDTNQRTFPQWQNVVESDDEEPPEHLQSRVMINPQIEKAIQQRKKQLQGECRQVEDKKRPTVASSNGVESRKRFKFQPFHPSITKVADKAENKKDRSVERTTAMAELVISGDHDDTESAGSANQLSNMQKLMMAWYNAGYQTGIFEAQQNRLN